MAEDSGLFWLNDFHENSGGSQPTFFVTPLLENPRGNGTEGGDFTVEGHAAGSQSGSSLLERSAFQLPALTEGAIPPEVEFWLFQEHAQFHQITPAEVIEERSWSASPPGVRRAGLPLRLAGNTTSRLAPI